MNQIKYIVPKLKAWPFLYFFWSIPVKQTENIDTTHLGILGECSQIGKLHEILQKRDCSILGKTAVGTEDGEGGGGVVLFYKQTYVCNEMCAGYMWTGRQGWIIGFAKQDCSAAYWERLVPTLRRRRCRNGERCSLSKQTLNLRVN